MLCNTDKEIYFWLFGSSDSKSTSSCSDIWVWVQQTLSLAVLIAVVNFETYYSVMWEKATYVLIGDFQRHEGVVNVRLRLSYLDFESLFWHVFFLVFCLLASSIQPMIESKYRSKNCPMLKVPCRVFDLLAMELSLDELSSFCLSYAHECWW